MEPFESISPAIAHANTLFAGAQPTHTQHAGNLCDLFCLTMAESMCYLGCQLVISSNLPLKIPRVVCSICSAREEKEK